MREPYEPTEVIRAHMISMEVREVLMHLLLVAGDNDCDAVEQEEAQDTLKAILADLVDKPVRRRWGFTDYVLGVEGFLKRWDLEPLSLASEMMHGMYGRK